MKFRELGTTSIRISEIGLGTAGLAGTVERPVRSAEALRIIDAAFANGINFFDTADSYGAGRSEKLLGKALGKKRDQVVLATKGGYQIAAGGVLYRLKPLLGKVVKRSRGLVGMAQKVRSAQKQQNFSAAYIRSACEKSLQRLGTDYIDLYQLHSPSPVDAHIQEAIECLLALKMEGKIRAIGISCCSESDVRLFSGTQSIDMLQAEVNLRNANVISGILKELKCSGKSIVARRVLSGGAATRFLEVPPRRTCRTAYSASILFALSFPSVASALIGTVNEKHLAENIEALSETPLSDEELLEWVSAGISN